MGENYPRISYYPYLVALWGPLLLWPFVGNILVWPFPSYMAATKFTQNTAIGKALYSSTNHYYTVPANT